MITDALLPIGISLEFTGVLVLPFKLWAYQSKALTINLENAKIKKNINKTDNVLFNMA